MTDPTIHFPPSFFSDANLAEMWSYVRYIVAYNSKLIMIIVAIITAGMVSVMLVEIPGMARNKGKSRDDEEDDDFEFY